MRIIPTLFLLSAVLVATASLASPEQIPEQIIENKLAELIKQGEPGCSIALIKQGKTWQVSKGLASIEYQTPLSSTTTMLTASTSKQFLGFAIMKLVQQGRLSLDQPIIDYLPKYKQYGAITIAQLLNHSSGVRSHWDTFEWSGKSLFDHLTPAMVEQKLLNTQTNFAANQRYHYSNGGYFLLTKIIEKVTKQRFVDYMQQNIFAPLGMNNSSYLDDYTKVIKNRADGYLTNHDGSFSAMRTHSEIVGPGHILTSLQDFTLWAKYLLTLDLDELYKPLSQYEQTLAGGTNNYFAGLFKQTMNGTRLFQHGGYYENWRQGFYLLPDKQMAIISLCNRSDFSTNALNYTIAASLLDWPAQVIKHDSLSTENNYPGTYYNVDLDALFDIRLHNDQLYYRGPVNSSYAKLSLSGTSSYQGLGFTQGHRISFSQNSLTFKSATLSGKFNKINLLDKADDKQLQTYQGSYKSAYGYANIRLSSSPTGFALQIENIGNIEY